MSDPSPGCRELVSYRDINLIINLTNKFHFAVVCSVIDAQMTSQHGKNKKVTHIKVAHTHVVRTDLLTTL